MNAEQNLSAVTDAVNESGVHQRETRSARPFVASLLMVFVILLMISVWVEVKDTAAGSRAAAAAPAAAESVPQVEYFPSAYVNQATEVTEHIQAF